MIIAWKSAEPFDLLFAMGLKDLTFTILDMVY